MKIYDCITYCGEDLLLKIRFETLDSEVDKFIIVEGDKYFNGEAKPKFFDLNKFKKFEKKIEYYFIKDFPKHNGDNYEYEHYQRNQIKRGFNGLKPNDVVLLSDADEIPNLKNKKFLDFDTAVFLQKMYYYKFNIHFYSGLKWKNKSAGTRSCKFKFFETGEKMRRYRVKNIPWWRFDRKIKRHVEFDGGWHFAFLMDIKNISEKLMRFNHEIAHLYKNKKYDTSNLVDLIEIQNRIIRFKDPYNRDDVKLRKVKIDSSLPKYILENINKYSDYII